eukprot:364838-Chlamydomonas_euryale.AAC.10
MLLKSGIVWADARGSGDASSAAAAAAASTSVSSADVAAGHGLAARPCVEKLQRIAIPKVSRSVARVAACAWLTDKLRGPSVERRPAVRDAAQQTQSYGARLRG